MKIETITIGSFATNCYLLWPDEAAGAEVVVIDTGLDQDGLSQVLARRQIRPVAVFLTHGHIDHIGGVQGLRISWPDVPVYIHGLDAPMLQDAQANLGYLAGLEGIQVRADRYLEDGQVIYAGRISLEVLHTPGHTPGSVSLYSRAAGVVFTGDALFAGSIGRTDLPGGNYKQLIGSIKKRLLVLPGKTQVYPGHGPISTIQTEARKNPFLAGNAY